MGLITELAMERLNFARRLLKMSWTPYESLTAHRWQPVPPEKQQEFVETMIPQLVARRKAIGMSGLAVDAKLGCAEYLTAKWECGMRAPSVFNLMCWAEALGCQWVLVPKPTLDQPKHEKD